MNKGKVNSGDYVSNNLSKIYFTPAVISLPGRVLTGLLLVALVGQFVAAKSLPTAKPASVGMSAERLALIDKAIERAILLNETPGAVVLVARRGRVVWRKEYGVRALVPSREEMTVDTIFDAASLTKVVATAT
ncbi:MAG: serine hydrolase, partial [Pyrinomonadaceae bacterium]